jgi:RNA recognition motif-containing protein
MPSDRKLKVRNFNEKEVSNEDLRKLFSKIGELKICAFDRNKFGEFIGSATVLYENPGDAKKAIAEYNGAYLDEKVLLVEYDMVKRPSSSTAGQGKTPIKVQKFNPSNKGKTLDLSKQR